LDKDVRVLLECWTRANLRHYRQFDGKEVTMPLTDAEIRAFKPIKQRFRRSDGSGLFLDVMSSGKKVFRLAYRSEGKQRTIWIGDYPTVRLADARLKVGQLKQKIRQGIDPKEEPATAHSVTENAKRPLWRDIARDYLMLRQRSGAAPRTLTKESPQPGLSDPRTKC